MATVDNSVSRMSKLLQQLQSGDTSGPRQRVRVAAVVAEAVERCRNREPAPELTDDSDDLHVWIDRERFVSVLGHLIRNAQEATRRDGHVRIRVAQADGGALIEIADDGCGMDAVFVRDRLFRPFDTTKGSKGMGIGAYQARMFVTDAGGSLKVESAPGEGTRFFVRLPVHDPGSAIPVP